VGNLSVINVIYIVFLVGSLAFGLEAMLIGFGGKLMVIYSRRRLVTLVAAILVGLVIVMLAVVTSTVFGLDPICFVIIVLLYSFVAGRLLKALSTKLVGRPPPFVPPKTSEEDMKKILVRRGYADLLSEYKERRRRRKVAPTTI